MRPSQGRYDRIPLTATIATGYGFIIMFCCYSDRVLFRRMDKTLPVYDTASSIE